MKTLREVLFERYQAAEPKLDAIRERVLAGLAPDAPVQAIELPRAIPRRESELEAGWRQFLWSLRWHLAGLSAAWVIVLLLNTGHTPDRAQAAPRQGAPSPRQLLAALRENQRQLRELIAAPASEQAPEPSRLTPSPRSEIQSVHAAAA